MDRAFQNDLGETVNIQWVPKQSEPGYTMKVNIRNITFFSNVYKGNMARKSKLSKKRIGWKNLGLLFLIIFLIKQNYDLKNDRRVQVVVLILIIVFFLRIGRINSMLKKVFGDWW